MQPRFTPDGKRIAFTSDRGGGDNLWIMNRDGSDPTPVTKESFRLLNSPAWSPDGEYARRAQALHLHALGRRRRDLALPPLGRRRPAADQAAERPEGPGRAGLLARRPLRLLQPGHHPGRRFEYNKDPNGQIYAIHRLDRETGEIERLRQRPGRRDPADAVARRQVAGLRAPRALPHERCSCRTSPPAPSACSTTASTATCRRPGPSTASTRRWPGRPTRDRSSSGRAASIQRIDVAQPAQSREIPFHVAATRAG